MTVPSSLVVIVPSPSGVVEKGGEIDGRYWRRKVPLSKRENASLNSVHADGGEHSVLGNASDVQRRSHPMTGYIPEICSVERLESIHVSHLSKANAIAHLQTDNRGRRPQHIDVID